jgi:pimeloyl-ACP methyl ester carboxylesterase
MSDAGLLTGFAQGQTALDTLRQPLRQLFNAPRMCRTTHGRVYEGQGQPAIVFPRQGACSESTAPLRRTLEEAGFRPFDWGLGRNDGPRGMSLHLWLRKLEEGVIDAFEVTQAPVTLIGWGLSGIYARELAKRANPLVRQVITLGAPFNTGADPQRRCKVLGLLDAGPERMPLALRNALRQRPPVPCTALYSKDDGVVRWEQCVEREATGTENIELPGVRHEELATHPRALEVITHRLAQPEGTWKPYEAKRLLS